MTTTVPVSARSTRKPIRKTAFGNECLTLLDRLELTRKRSTGRAFALGMTSCLPGEGVTTIAAETAAAAAGQLELRTLLVDCRFARPSVHRFFGVGLCPGSRDVLEDQAPVRDVLQKSGAELLSLLTAATVGRDRRDVRLAATVEHVAEELGQEFDLFVFDLPPLNQCRLKRVAPRLDGILLVVEAERVHFHVADRATTLLKADGVNLLGAVMNKRREHLPEWLNRSTEG